MTDILTPKQRKLCMSRIKGKNTQPEWVVRRLVYSLGFRYRLHRKDLPGKPDIVFVRLRKVIFVHGCFWHRHTCKYGKVMPATRKEFWQKKLEGNKQRDRLNERQLKKMGWEVAVVWECEIRDMIKLESRLVKFLRA